MPKDSVGASDEGGYPYSEDDVREQARALTGWRADWVAPGPAVVQFQNSGEDPHDLKLQRVGGARELGTGELGPGEFASLPQIRLKRASRYRLWCSLENHVSYGMEATLRVKRRR